MTITLDYSDLTFDDERSVLLAEETDFQYDLLYAHVVFRVGPADFTLEGGTPLLDAAAGLRWLMDLLADGEDRTYASPTRSPSPAPAMRWRSRRPTPRPRRQLASTSSTTP
jgi:hypothetical protein